MGTNIVYELTDRQSEVLGLVAKGFSNAEVAEILGLSAGTVKVHMSAILARLDVSNRTEAVTMWLGQTLTEASQQTTETNGASDRACFLLIDAPDAAEITQYVTAVLRNRGHTVPDPTTTKALAAVNQNTGLAATFAQTYHLYMTPVQEGETLSITVSCIDRANGRTLHRGQYQRTIAEAAVLGAEIGIDLHTAHIGHRTAPASPPITSDDGDYWQAKYAFAKRTPESLQKALGLFQTLTRAQPDFTDAHVGLANTACQLGVYVPGMAVQFYKMGKASAERALETNPESAPAHAALGYAQLFGEWDVSASERSLQRGVALDPDYDEGLIWLSLWHMFTGDHARALDLSRAALKQNPLSIPHFVHVAHVLRSQGDLPAANDHLAVALEMEPGNLRSLIWAALCQVDGGSSVLARRYIDRALAAHPTGGILLGVSAYIAGRSGDMDLCRKTIETLENTRTSPTHSPVYEAFGHIALGDHDTAIPLIRQGYPQRVPMLLGWACDPVFQHLRDHADFAAIAQEIGIRR